MTDLQRIQLAVGEHLIPEARLNQSAIFPTEETLPIALELFYTAMAMKKAHQPGALCIARRYAARMGLDENHVEAFAIQRLTDALRDAEEGQ